MQGIIFSGGSYPYGSWANRTRHWVKGFKANGIETELIIQFPPPLIQNVNESENFVHFINKPVKIKQKKNIHYIYLYIKSVFKSYYYLKKRNVNFVLFAGGSFAECILIQMYCKRKKIKFMIEVVDENSKKFSDNELSFIDKLAKLNKNIFDKQIIKKSDALFVLSSFLENKYRNKFPDLTIIRTVPSLIDIYDFKKRSKNNIYEIEQEQISVFKSDELKIVYVGSCERTNGLEFFLECAKTIIDDDINFKIIFVCHIGDINKLKKIVINLKLEEYVVYLNAVLPKYIPAIYVKSDILLLPEHGDVIANAGFPGKTAEYLASGKALISTIFSDLTDYLVHGKNAMLAPIGNYEIYIDNLRRLILDENLRLYLGENAKKTASKYFHFINGVNIYINEFDTNRYDK